MNNINSDVTFKDTIEMLSKGAAQAVTTLNSSNDFAENLKRYLYIKTPVEKELLSVLSKVQEKRVIFLCGSSGDGKSEIFRRIHQKFSTKFDFHLDATHSFDPSKNAVQTLNERFSNYKKSLRPLVIGINIGMLGNFATDGAEEHKDICESIRNFLGKGKESNSEHIFINFEQFPKFELKNENFKATFIGPILKRICAPVRENPIYLKWKQEPNNTNLHRNFALLCIPEIQEQICLLLFYAHLKFDQFLTARTVLDFICQILVRKGLLFDNIFCGPNTELFRALRMFDPCHARSKSLDLFQVKASLGLFEPDFYDFRAEIENRFRIEVFEPHSWIRLFYMLQDAKLGNNYHQQFRIDLQRNLFDDYREVWQLHRDYDGNSKENKTKLRNFYKNVLIPAVRRFANRLAPKLHYDRFFLGKINGFEISAKSSLQLNLKKIAASRPDQLRSFDAYLKVGNNCNVGPIPISSRFLDLARKINKGYRPNTHDKTTVVKLEELVEEIHRILRKSDVLYFKQKNHEWKLINEKEEDEILAVSL